MTRSDAVLALASEWDSEARRLRETPGTDATAQTLDWCAATLRERVTIAVAGERSLTPSEYATLKQVTPQAVTKWIRSGKVEAYRDERGRWHIPSHAAAA